MIESDELDVLKKRYDLHSVPLKDFEAYNACTKPDLIAKVTVRKLTEKANKEIGGTTNAKKAKLIKL